MTDAAPKRIWAWYLHNKMRNDAMEGGWTASPDKREHAYILVTPEALASSPEVAALIREAEARGMERAAARARVYASNHELASDGRNTLIMLAEWADGEAAAIRSEATK